MSKFNPFSSSEGSKSTVGGDKKSDLKGVDEEQDQNPDNKQTKEEDADNKGEICQMKRGDYMIHVFVEQAKNLKVDAEETVDPIVQINCLGERKFTTAQDDINNTGIAYWNEHIFFEPKNLETEQLERAKV